MPKHSETSISKEEAVKAYQVLEQYYKELAHVTLNRKRKLDYAEKAYDFEVSGRHLEKYGP